MDVADMPAPVADDCPIWDELRERYGDPLDNEEVER